jgi:hypothetical protein
MKSSFLVLSVLAVAAVGLVDAQQAQAQGSRFKFAANTWKQEQPKIPGSYDAPAQVRAGSVPQGSNFLGVDPAMLSKPPVQQQVAARPVPQTQISHKLFVPGTSFKPSFGKPVQPLQAGEPMKMATLPPGAGSPIPMAAPPTAPKQAATPVHHTSSAPRHHHAQAVTGRLRTPTHTRGESAPPAQVASYNTGYVPGGHLPAQSGVGMSTRADVSGTIIHHK